jgi:hypothetical protein
MASITPTEFRVRFPEFEDDTKYPDDVIQMFIDDTECLMSEGPWRCAFHKAQACLVAHWLTLRDWTKDSDPSSSIGKGAIKSSESEGDVSQSLHTGSNGQMQSGKPADDLYMTTLYGRMYVQLRDTTLIGVVSTGPGVSVSPFNRYGLAGGQVGTYGVGGSR